MEEQKDNKNGQKLTYEQLKEAADKLWNDNRYLRQEVQKASEFINTINRLDYLFKVVEISHNNRNNSVSFADEFVEKCITEIQDGLTLPEQKEEKEDN